MAKQLTAAPEVQVHCRYTKLISISALKPHPQNPNKHPKQQLELLAKIIKEQGWRAPITVSNLSGYIIRGHGRMEAAQLLGLDKVPVEYQNYKTEEDEKADLIADNKIAELAEMDDDTLKALMLELEAAKYDVELTGMSEDDVTDITGEDKEEEEIIEPPIKPITKPGDIYELGAHRLICGDGTDLKTYLQLMDGKKAIVFTDPPYNVGYGQDGNPAHKQRKIKNDKQGPAAWRAFNDGIIAVLKAHSEGDIYVWGAPGPEGMRQRLHLAEAGVHWSTTIVWKKQHFVMGAANYQRIYEPCFYGWINKSSFCGKRNRTDVWEFDRPMRSDMRPTMKPVEMCAFAIRNSSKPGDLVLDMFGGSGSTLIAAEITGRACRMVELEPGYCDVIVRRYKDYCINKNIKPIVRLNGRAI